MGVAHHRHVDVALAVHLLLGDDDLSRQLVFGVGYGVVQQADAPKTTSTFRDTFIFIFFSAAVCRIIVTENNTYVISIGSQN